MSALSYGERAKLWVTNLSNYLRSKFRPKSILSALANKSLKKVEKVNGGYEASVITVKAGALNSGAIKGTDFTQEFTQTSHALVVEKMMLDEKDDFNDPLEVEILNKENMAPLVSEFGKQRSLQFEQKKEVDFVSNYLFSHIDNFIVNADATTVNGNVSAGATTFDVADATNIEVGSIVFIGYTNPEGAVLTVPVLVKTLSGTTITIETDSDLFPLGGVKGNKRQFKKLRTVLPEISSGAKVVIDTPFQATPENLYDLLQDLETTISEFDVPEEGLYIHGQTRPLKLLKKKDSPLISFQNLKEMLSNLIIKKGKFRELEDAIILQNTNGMARTVAGKQRYYIQLFKEGFSIHSIDWLTALDSDKITGTAGLSYNISGVQMYGSHVFEEGSKAMATLVIEL